MPKSRRVPAVPLQEVLASQIRGFREARGLTQDALAEQMAALGFGWSRSTVAEVEGRGRGRRVSIEELVGLCLISGFSAARFFGPHPSISAIAITPDVELDYSRFQRIIQVGDEPDEATVRVEMERELTLARQRVETVQTLVDEDHAELERQRAHVAAVETRLASLRRRAEEP